MIEIEYNISTKRFLIKAHAATVEVVRTLPNKRWDSKRCLWIAPALSTNIHVLKGILSKYSDVIKISADAENTIINAKPIERCETPFPLNYVFRTNPFKHQRAALDKIWGNKASALFMEPGTGKSKVAIDWFCALFASDAIDAVVVFCPVSIKMNWQDQVLNHSTQNCSVELQGAKKKVTAIPISSIPVLVCGIESMSSSNTAIKDVAAFMSGRNVAMVVDESHLIKTHDSLRTKNICSIGKKAKYKLCLTGTPVTQGIMDLYSQFEFLDTDILGIGDFYSFRNRYAIMGGFESKQIIGYQNVEELTEIVKPFIFQCRKHEVLDLPPKVYQKRYVELTSEQSKTYKQMKRDRLAFLKHDGIGIDMSVENILTVYQHLQTITSGFVYTQDKFGTNIAVKIGVNPKITELCKVVEDLPEDANVIVWCRFREEIAQAQVALAKYGGVSMRTGSMTEEEKQVHLQSFKAGRNRFFVSSQAAGGVGLTLNEATVAIYLSNTFSTTDRIQSEDRCFAAGTRVMTPLGFVNIEDIEVGDTIIGGLSGLPRKVVDAWKTPNVEVVEVNISGAEFPVMCTKNHEFLISDGKGGRTWERVEAMKIANRSPRVVSTNFCAIENNNPDVDIDVDFGAFSHSGNPKNVGALKLSDDMLFMFGYYIGDGFCRTDPSKSSTFVSFAGNTAKKAEALNKITQLITSFGLNANKRFEPGRTGCEIRFYSKQFSRFMADNFGRVCEEKKIPGFLVPLSKRQSKIFMSGLLASDGYVRNNYAEYICKSDTLAAQVCLLASLCGYRPSIRHQTCGCNIVGFSLLEGAGARSLTPGRLKSCCPAGRRDVYDITVEYDECFLVENCIIAHNCHRIGQSASVLYVDIVAKDTIDEHILKAIESKMELAEYIKQRVSNREDII